MQFYNCNPAHIRTVDFILRLYAIHNGSDPIYKINTSNLFGKFDYFHQSVDPLKFDKEHVISGEAKHKYLTVENDAHLKGATFFISSTSQTL